MYPNPQDVLPLPSGADVAAYEQDAAALVRAAGTGDDALAAWAAAWVSFRHALQLAEGKTPPRHEVERTARQVAAYARARLAAADDAPAEARAILARAHGFADWEALTAQLDALRHEGSPVADFERAADAIVSGDLATLDALLARAPALVHQRSTRVHRATLLHYVAANGVENYRQHTPPNILAVAERLLDAGADVHAEADMYGGGAKVLGLTVTSAHPRGAGVQLQLADLLLARGAPLEPRIVHAALMNGCPEAAAHLAAKGAEVRVEEAAGIGRLDLLSSLLAAVPPATDDEVARALLMAAWYDHRDVVAFLLDRRVAVDTRHPADGETALHIAAYLGNEALVELLLGRGAPVNVVDGRHGTPPIVWALHAWLVERREPAARFPAVLRRLAEAGATVRRDWIDDERVRADAALWDVLQARVRDE